MHMLLLMYLMRMFSSVEVRIEIERWKVMSSLLSCSMLTRFGGECTFLAH